MTSTNTFGKNLRTIRNRLGKSQADMARILGMRDSTLSRFETGTRPAPKSSVFYIKLSEIPGVTKAEVQALREAAESDVIESFNTKLQWKEIQNPNKKTGAAYITVGDLEVALQVTSSQHSYYDLENLAQWVMTDVEWLLQERQRRHSMMQRID